MTPVNLGVCFGPSLLRPEVETVSSIYDIKFRNAIVELIIIHYEKMFQNKLEQTEIDEMVGTNENGENSVVNLSNSLSSLAVRTLSIFDRIFHLLFFFSQLHDEHQLQVHPQLKRWKQPLIFVEEDYQVKIIIKSICIHQDLMISQERIVSNARRISIIDLCLFFLFQRVQVVV